MTAIKNETTPTFTERAIRHLVPVVDGWGDARTPSRSQARSEFDLSALTTDALIGSGHALLAIREELADIRSELTGLRGEAACRADDLNEIAAAIRDLTAAITATRRPARRRWFRRSEGQA